MTQYSFKETVNYFSDQLGSQPPEEDIEDGVVELTLDENRVLLMPADAEGSFRISIDLGMMIGPISKEHLEELNSSNFLGVNTGGCTLALDDEGSTLTLIATTTSGTPPQENWEWLHRIYSIAAQWTEHMSSWEEFTSLTTFTIARQDVSQSPGSHRIFKA